jgi:hypothetical protein
MSLEETSDVNGGWKGPMWGDLLSLVDGAHTPREADSVSQLTVDNTWCRSSHGSCHNPYEQGWQ